MDWIDRQLDVLEVLKEAVQRFTQALEDKARRPGYVEGQLAYLRALSSRLDAAPADAEPATVLEAAAGDLGLSMEDGELASLPSTQEEAGSLSMWGLCLGFVEGVASGAQATMEALDEVPGVGTRFEGT